MSEVCANIQSYCNYPLPQLQLSLNSVFFFQVNEVKRARFLLADGAFSFGVLRPGSARSSDFPFSLLSYWVLPCQIWKLGLIQLKHLHFLKWKSIYIFHLNLADNFEEGLEFPIRLCQWVKFIRSFIRYRKYSRQNVFFFNRKTFL